MFLGNTKKIFILLLIIFSNNLVQGKENQNDTKNYLKIINKIKKIDINKNLDLINKNLDIISLTAKRIIFKSFIKSAWKMSENRYKSNNYADIKYKLGVVASDLIIDETLPSENQNKIQKISESLAPIIISECILYRYRNSLYENNPYGPEEQYFSRLVVKTLGKLVIKTIKANFFLDKENKYYNHTKYSTIPLTFFDTKNYNFNLKAGTKNIINEAVKTVMASKQINIGKTLNKKHRKKAITKAINIMIEPLINDLFA